MYFEALNSHKNLILLSKARPSCQQDSWKSCGFPFPAGVTESSQSSHGPPFAVHVFSSAEDILGEFFIGEEGGIFTSFTSLSHPAYLQQVEGTIIDFNNFI